MDIQKFTISPSIFKKDVRFDWGICGLSSTAEVLMTPTKSISLGGSVTEKKVFLEGRNYFKDDHQGAFMSLRVSSRLNLGFVIGSRDTTDFGIFTSKIGCYFNTVGNISPTIGIGWEL